MNRAELEAELDFSGRKKENIRQEGKILSGLTSKLKHEKFRKIAIGVLGALVLGGTVVSGDLAWNSHIADKVHAEEAIVTKANVDQVFNAIDLEKQLAEKTYVTNNILFSKYAEEKEIVEIMNLQSSIADKVNRNKSIYGSVINTLNSDRTQVEAVFAATGINVSMDVKEKELLEGSDIKKFNDWHGAVNSGQHMYVDNLLKIGKDTEKELAFLEETKAEIIKTVQEKIKSKDYNLDATKTALSDNVSKDLQSNIGELKEIRNTVKGTEQDGSLTDKDVADAQEAIDGLQSEAIDKIAQDKATVENMINKIDKQQPTQPQGQQQPTVVHDTKVVEKTVYVHDNHMNMLDYYLLYSWLNGSTSHSPAVIVHNNYNNTYANPIQRNLAQYSSDRYNIKNENSYLNKRISNTWGNSANTVASTTTSKYSQVAANSALSKVNAYKKIDISSIKAKIEQTKAKAYTARNTYKTAQTAKFEATKSKSYSSSSPTMKTTTSSSWSKPSSSRRSSRRR